MATADAVRKHVERAAKGGFENGMDPFLAIVNESGTVLLYVSYIGGGSYLSTDLTWTSPGRLMIYGSTNSRSLPLSDVGSRCFLTRTDTSPSSPKPACAECPGRVSP